ncbi:MAG: translesion error-prone DNA polymerase V autoproteolytic subunit [Tatlockia sp.]|nr:translesion error-prone DNA polymerase V autoproteolytic subunit [Tatlockia sp.]
MATHGGKRDGAGRARKEETRHVRVPLSKMDAVLAIKDSNYQHTIPLYSGVVAAGLLSPADDNVEEHVNLQQYLIKRPEKTFLVRASGDSMINAGIKSGALLIVDSSKEPADGKIVIATINGELTVKRLSVKVGRVKLMPENPIFSPIEVTQEMNFSLCGVVTHVIHET